MDAAAPTSTAAAELYANWSERLSAHFSVGEFVASQEATRLVIDNRLPLRLLADACRTAAMLERIRSHLSALAGHEVPLVVSSGYRCLRLNRTLGSKDDSDHVVAGAADWKAPAFGTPIQIATALAPQVAVLGIGQLIHEFGEWVHTGRRIPVNPADRVITIDHLGTRSGVWPARLERRA